MLLVAVVATVVVCVGIFVGWRLTRALPRVDGPRETHRGAAQNVPEPPKPPMLPSMQPLPAATALGARAPADATPFERGLAALLHAWNRSGDAPLVLERALTRIEGAASPAEKEELDRIRRLAGKPNKPQ